MKYGKRNAEMQARMEAFADNFIKYKDMKKKINDIVECYKEGGCCAPGSSSPKQRSRLMQAGCRQEFMVLLETSQEHVFKFMDESITRLNERLVSTMQRIAAPMENNERVLEDASAELAGFCRDTENIALFAYHNTKGFRKVLKKYSKKVGVDLAPLMIHQFREQELAWDDAFYQMVVAFGDAHKALRASFERQASGSSAWKPPASFERTTRKYLVQIRDIRKVELLIAEHLPVLVIGRKAVSAGTVPDDFLHVSKEAWISSVYFDDNDFSLYHGRIKRDEGARLFRLRWYGHFREPPDDGEVFVERKTHHESWVQESSVKERFALRCDKVQSYLTGVYHHSESKEKSALIGTSLADEIQSEIMEKELKAKVRTVYKRTAFQRTDSNAVRISIDTDLSFVDEAVYSANGDYWCQPVPTGGFQSNQIVTFPWAVLEIKLTEGQPDWIEQLLGSGLIHELHKFSKFAHGIASFQEASGKLTVMPYWHERLKDLEGGSYDLASGFGFPVCVTVGDSPARHGGDQSLSTGTSTIGDMENSDRPTAPTPQLHLRRRLQAKARRWRRRMTLPGSGKNEGAQVEKGGVPKRPAKIEPKTFFANERTFVQWISSVLSLVAVSLGLQGLGDFIKNDVITWVGVILNVMAVMWMCYALYIYLHRLRKIKRADPHGWDLYLGPVMLVVILGAICVMGTLSLLATHYAAGTITWTVAAEPLLASAGCAISRRTDFPELDIEPSGLVYHPQRRSVFVVSQGMMYELPEAGGAPLAAYAMPGLDLEGVAFDPAIPNRIIVAHEGTARQSGRLHSVNLSTSEVGLFMDFENVTGLESFRPEAISFCPVSVCGGGSAHYMVAGTDRKVHVIRVETDPIRAQSHQGILIESFDATSMLCRLAGRCKEQINKLSGLSVTDDAIHVINDDDTRELWIFRLNTTSSTRSISSVDIHRLPNVPGWEGIIVRDIPDAAGSAGGSFTVTLASDDMAFISEFKLTASEGLISRCASVPTV